MKRKKEAKEKRNYTAWEILIVLCLKYPLAAQDKFQMVSDWAVTSQYSSVE